MTSLYRFLALSAIVISVVAGVSVAVTPRVLAVAPCIELQSRAWGTPAGQSFNEYEGVDEGTCLPLGSVSGTVSFPLHIGLRHNPVSIDQIRVYVADAAHGNGVLVYDSGIHMLLTGTITGNTAADLTIPVNVDVLGSGWKELRFQTRVYHSAFPSGQLSFATTGWQVQVNSGSSTYRPLCPSGGSCFTEARSWWGNAGPYVHVRFRSPLPTTVSGVWHFTVQYPDGNGQTSVDTDSHADPMVLGPNLNCTSACTLDTRTLANGPHFLFLRSDRAIAGGTSSSVETIGFTVAN